MIPISILQSLAKAYFQFPLFLTIANNNPDPIEKFKYTITACISCFHNCYSFLKPLNPILGETFETCYEDGTRVKVFYYE